MLCLAVPVAQIDTAVVNLATCSIDCALPPYLELCKLGFSALSQGGMAAPPGICRSIGTLYLIALRSLTSL